MKPNEEKPDRHIGSSPAQISDPKLRYEAQRAVVWALVIGSVLFCAYMARPLLIIFGGMVVAAMIDGGARLLGRALKIPRTARIAIIMLGAVAFLFWFVTYAGSSIAEQAAELPGIVEAQGRSALQWARANGFKIDPSSIQSISSQLMSGVGTLTRALSGLLGGITMLILILFLGVFIALEPRLYERGVAWMLPEERRKDYHVTMSIMARNMRHLLGGRLFGMVVEGIFTWFMLFIYGVPMAVLLGMLTGMLAFIPNVGAVISGVLMVTVGFSGGTEMGLYTIFVYFFVQTIDGYLLIPLIAKKTVDLAPALVLGAQLIMGVLFGILGLALADPLMAMLKVALERRAQRNDKEKALAADEEPA